MRVLYTWDAWRCVFFLVTRSYLDLLSMYLADYFHIQRYSICGTLLVWFRYIWCVLFCRRITYCTLLLYYTPFSHVWESTIIAHSLFYLLNNINLRRFLVHLLKKEIIWILQWVFLPPWFMTIIIILVLRNKK